jgi:alkanesulfonate monooxygenase SsuD/methylene tetrahydromethanopterin reductase-like flavin-dependent oxidoreductase (luciferase family)
MKLGLTGGVSPGARWDKALLNARLADQLGYDSIWLGETWGYELFSSMSDIARNTERIKIGAGIANVFTRSAALIAMSAATVDEQSKGRVLLGLGSSGHIVIERLHGIREYTDVINTLIRGDRLDYHGELLELTQGFRLRMNPIRDHIPIYVASLTPKSLQQSGEIADGVLPIYWPGWAYGELRKTLDDASLSVGRPAGSVVIAPYITTALVEHEDERAALRRAARDPVAFYIGRMGDFYAEHLERHGYSEEVAAVRKGWADDHDAAAAGVSDRLLDDTALVGTADEIAEKLRLWMASGLDEPLLGFAGAGQEKVERTLRALAPLNEE